MRQSEKLNKKMAALKAQLATMDPAAIHTARFPTKDSQGFREALRASGAFRVESIKAKSAVESYTDALQKQDLTFKNWRKSATLRNAVLREQWKLQQMMVMGWKEDAKGRMTGDMVIPRGAPERLGSFSRSLADVRSGAASFGQVLAENRMRLGIWAEGLKSASHNMVNWGKNTQWAGRQMMVGLTIPMVAFAGAAGMLAYNIDKELTKIVKVYDFVGDNITGQTEKLRKDSMETARFMAKQYAQAATDTLAITASLAATGQTGRGLQRSTQTVGRAMFLGDLNQEDAIKTAISLQTVYAKKGETSAEMNGRLAESFDYLNALENATNLSMRDMTIAVPKLSGVVNALGGDVKDIGVLMTAATSGGINAAEAANALKTVLFRQVSPTNGARESFLAATGKDIDEILRTTQGKAIPTLIEMGKAMQGMDNITKAGFLKEFFGIYQGSKAGIIAANMLNIADAQTQVGRAYKMSMAGPEEWAKIRQREEEAMRASASGQFKIAIESLKVEMAELGKTALPVATGILKFFGGIVKGINGLSSFNKHLFLGALAFGAIIGPAVMITGVLATLFATLIRSGATFTVFLTKFRLLNADQKAAAMLSDQTSLAWHDQATSAQVLAATLAKVNSQMSTMAVNQEINARAALNSSIPLAVQNMTRTKSGTGLIRNEKGQFQRASAAQMAQHKEWAHSTAILDNTRKTAEAQEKVAKGTDKVARGMGRASGAGLSTVGMIGLMASGTNKWMMGLSMALMLWGSLNIAAKTQAVWQAIITARTAATTAAQAAQIPLMGRGFNLVNGTAAGAKAFTTSLAAAIGPVGALIIAVSALAGVMLYIKRLGDKQIENYKKLGEVAKGAADAMGVAYTDPSQISEDDSPVKRRISLAQTLNEKYGEQMKIISKMSAANAKREAAQIGLQFYMATGNNDKANELMNALLAAAGKKDINKDVWINFKTSSQDTLLEGFKDKLDNMTSEDFGKTLSEKIMGNKGEHWYSDQSHRLTGKAKAEGERQGKALGDALNQALEDGDTQGAQALLDKIQDEWQNKVKGIAQAATKFMGNDDQAKFESIFGFKPTDIERLTQLMLSKGGMDKIKKEGFGRFFNEGDLKPILQGYRQYLEATARAGGVSKESAAEIKALDLIIQSLPGSSIPAASGQQQLAAGINGVGDAADSTANSLATMSDAQQKAMEVQKGVMSKVWSGVMEMAEGQLDDTHNRAVDEIEAGGKRRIDAIEAEQKAKEKEFDSRGKALDKKQKDEQGRFDANWDHRTDVVTQSYDDRIKKIDDEMEALQKAEDLRQKMFEAEKARIQRLAEMYNQNIDVNIALNSGDMDEAARLTNTMRATQEQWAVDDAAATSGDALAQAQEKANSQKETLGQQKDDALEKLKDARDTAKDILKDRQDAEKEALDAEKERYQEGVDARKAAEEKKTQAAVEGSNKRYEAEKKSLDMALEQLRVVTPKNAAEVQQYTNRLAAIYAEHGMHLDTKSKEWADYVARAMRSASNTAKAEMNDEVKWSQIGASIGDEIAQGMLGMTFEEFMTWMTTGKMPAHNTGGATAGGAAHFRQAEENTMPRNTNAPGGNTYRQQVPAKASHSGGPVSTSRSSRAGRPMNASLYSDEVPIIAQKGEFMMQRSAVDKIGLSTLQAMNNGNFHHSGGLLGGIGGMAQGLLRMGVKKGMELGVARVRGADSGAPVGNYPVGADFGEDGFASWLTPTQRQVEPNILAKVWAALAKIPGSQKIISGFRPGAIVAGTNRPSLHGFGKAVDIGANAYDPAQSAMGDAIAKLFRSGAVPGVSEVLWKTMKGGNHFDHVHVGFRHGGGEIGVPGMKIGGNVKYDNTIANLHKGEKVLTAPLSSALERGINNLDGAGNVTYDIDMDFRGAVIRDEVDIERAVKKVLNEHESKLGRKRVIK